MMYPTVVTVVAIGITIFLLVKVVPVFGEIFKSFGAKLPAPTQYLINLSNIRAEVLSSIHLGRRAARFMAGFISSRPKPGREFWDARRIKLPVFGHIAHKICLARFTRTFASLIRSGVPILEVMQIVRQHRRQRGHGKGHQDGRRPTSNVAKASPAPWPNIRFSRP